MQNYAGSINLHDLQHDLFQNLKSTRRFVLDIGGTLAKVAYIAKKKRRLTLVSETTAEDSDADQGATTANLYSVTEEERESDTMHFVKFETKYLESCLHFIRTHILGEHETDANAEQHDAVSKAEEVQIKVTGGGAYKYTSFLSKTLQAKVDKLDEITCMVRGLNFVLRNIADEAFRFERNDRGTASEIRFEAVSADALFPYLLVVVGSGVSIVKVTGHDRFERVGGTCVGGGTFCGLGALLADNGTSDFDELLQLAECGDQSLVDAQLEASPGGAHMTVFFGKPSGVSLLAVANERLRGGRDPAPRKANDLVKSVLVTIATVVGQLAAAYARVHSLRRVYFGGYFIRAHAIAMQTITEALARHSETHVGSARPQALFLRHEGYLGAIGALLTQLLEDDARSSWAENVATSSALPLPTEFSSVREVRSGSDANRTDAEKTPFSAKRLELDKFERRLAAFPLLRDVTAYQPDTFDLAPDSAARAYWISCLLDANTAFAERAYRSQAQAPGQNTAEDARTRKERFASTYAAKLTELRDRPLMHCALTVRTLLDWREQCLRECGFADAFIEQKRVENERALLVLDKRLEALDKLQFDDRQLELVRGVLAGNVFDWGAKTVADLLESDPLFNFEKALSVLQNRPWLVDNLESWRDYVRAANENGSLQGRLVLIMCDNSGFDIVCGIVPFARELLRLGAKVALVANSHPALNDVTFSELQILVKRLCAMRPELAAAVDEGRLRALPNGQSSPCLDLRFVDADLAELARKEPVALVVLVGMGRAIHTNLNALFSCCTLKLAVLKNDWLARHLGGSMFSVVCKFESV